jgi:hypothetical protein
VAVIQDDPAQAGLADLAYAPALADSLGPYLASAPEELSARAQPIADRARAAVDSLRALGLKDRDIKRLAKAAPDALLGPDSPDGTAVRDKLVKQLEKKVDPQQLRQAAADFLAAQGDPTPLMDLGLVSREVGIAAGYPCASERE